MQAGRLDEARCLLNENRLAEFLPGKRLAAALASRFAARAQQLARSGDWLAGWRDLEVAAALAEGSGELAEARQAVVAAALREAESELARGNGAAALAVIDKLERRQVAHADLRTLREVARRLESDEPSAPRSGSRFLLWVDGVGGYLVCLSDEVVCGRASPGNCVDLPILADISRRHAAIRRGDEGYVLEPLHASRINGRPVQGKTLLSDGDEIALGRVLRIRFRQPHALSGSARLEFVSPHRPQPYADGVLLMAESCILGPQWQNHVVCREWAGDVVLFRQDGGLFCRARESIEIDGQWCDGPGRLDGNPHVVGSDFSFTLEELDRCATQPLR